MNLAHIPKLDLNLLEQNNNPEPTDFKILGYSVNSWLKQVDRLGPVFQANLDGNDSVIIATAQANAQAWKTPSGWAYRPTDAGTFFRNQMGNDHISALDGEPHRRLRKLVLPGFGAAALQRDIKIAADTITSGFADLAGQSTNIHETLCRLYAQSFTKTQIKVDISEAQLAVLNRFEEEFICGLQLSLADQAKWFGREKYQQLRKEAFDYFNRVVMARKSGEPKNDSLAILLGRKLPDGSAPLMDHELAQAVYFLSVAGVGNVANLLCPLMWAIKGTEWIPRLQDELKGFTPQKLTGMKDFPIMRALITEAERCFAPTEIVPKRTTVDIEILGKNIPANTLVSHLHVMSHFEAARYPDPLKFKPERWLSEDLSKPNAFGGGKHMCLGMGVTRVYMPLTLALIYTEYDVEITEPPVSKSLEPDFEPAPRSTVMNTRLVRRQP